MNARGQALAEFSVAIALLAWILVCLPVLQRYHALAMAAQMDARTLAYSRAWQQAGGLAGAAESRPPSAIEFAGDPALPRDSAPQVTYAARPVSTEGSYLGQALLAPYRLAGQGEGPVGARGSIVAHVHLPTTTAGAMPPPFDGLDLALDAIYALPIDDWSASGPVQAEQRSGLLVPTARLPALRAIARALAAPLALLEPAFRDFCPGHIDAEVVPADRLGPPDPSLAPAGRHEPC